MKVYQSLLELVGKTPLVSLEKGKWGLITNIFVKLECFNPLSSVKDRAAYYMIEEAEREGRIIPGKTTLIEPTSGNTGIGLAWIAAIKGYRLILVMPESMSVERRKILKFLGAELVLTPAEKGMKGAVEKAYSLQEEIKNSFIPSQFDNPANPKAHYETTGPEIWEATQGKVDIFIAGIGTGGTISGAGRFLKEKNPKIKVYGVEPEDSPVITQGTAGPHKIQGIGAGFIPKNLDLSVVDKVFTVAYKDAIETSKVLARKEGIFVGISSGAALKVALQVGEELKDETKNIVVILPDTAERYISTELFSE